MKKFITVLLALSLIANIFVFPLIAKADLNSAISYLDGKGQNPWISMALVSAGKTINIDYLKDISGTSATDYEAATLAILAAGEDPRTFPREDFIEKIKNFYLSDQIGDASALNDDIFGILALSTQNDENSKTIITGAKNFLLSNQNTDGGFPFMVSGGSDTNMTAMSAMALLSVGVSKSDTAIINAIDYLKSTQNNDGGFPYDPQSSWGTDSDASSDAWVLSLIHALGDDVSNWSKNGKTPEDHLLTLQHADGFFKYQADSDEDSFSPVTTAYSVIALSKNWYPVLTSGISSLTVPQVKYKFEGSSGVICEGDAKSKNAMELVEVVSSSCGFTYVIEDTSFGSYLKKIGNDEAHDSKGWLYAVNFISPNVGASEYVLEQGDYVIWHFGGFDWQSSGTSILLSATVFQTSQNNDSNNDEVSFSVDIDSGSNKIALGEISVGESKSAEVTLTNTGLKNLHFEATVAGDMLFRENLKIDSTLWRNFTLELFSKESKKSTVELRVPIYYSGSGNKNGTLTFWATEK